MKYVPLYIKTNNSLLNSMIKLNELVKKAQENHFTALTITDNNMYGVLDFYYLCLKNNIKPIIGLEIKIQDKKIVLYCKNYQGYQNLCKLSTIMSDSKLNLEHLKQFSQNIICIVPFKSLNLYNDLNKIFQDIFIGYENKEQLENLNYSNLVYMKEVLYLDKTDSYYYPYLTCIKDGKIISENEFSTYNNHLDTYQYVLENFNEHLNNNYKIFDMCNLVIPKLENLLPKYNCPDHLDSYTYLKHLCKEGLKNIFFFFFSKVYIDRLKYELDVINKMGFCDYFLVVFDYVKYAKEKGILVGPGRGSAAGSLVSYCLNITTIDPIKYNLMFERFLNPERVSMPDIDIDFADDRREEVIEYCTNKYGIKKVAPIITFGTLKTKQVIRDVARVMDIDLKQVDNMSKLLDPYISLADNLKNEKVKKYLDFNKQFAKCYKIAMKFEGLKRHSSIHAAGIVMCNEDLDNIIPLDKHENEYLTGFDMTYLEQIGLLKMDFLGLKNLTLITNILKDIDTELTFDNIPLNDLKVLEIFTSANTIGIFQFESSGMINFLRKFRPSTFEDIIASIALFRPGPMKNIDLYIRRKKGLEKIDYLDPSLESVLKPTYGIIVYQEQIMQIAHIMTDYTLGEADILRRAMSKKKEDILLKEKDKFILRSLKKGYKKEVALKVYNLILKFASYGFNRAHSVAYSVIAYKMAYLKYYYPKIFLKNILSNVMGSSSDTKKYIYEAKLNNIKILSPDINISTENYEVSSEGIIYPLAGIKNVGLTAIQTILKARSEGKFKDVFDFAKRTYGKSINRKTLESLIMAGCFDSFNLNKKTLYMNLDAIINYSEIGELLDEESLKPIIKKYDEYSDQELLAKEFEVFGFYLNNHPVTKYKFKYSSVAINKLDSYFDKIVNTIVYVDKIKKITTKKGEEMCFITGSDEVSNLDIVMFPKIYNVYKDIKVGDILLLNGKIEKRFDKIQLVVNKAKKLID